MCVERPTAVITAITGLHALANKLASRPIYVEAGHAPPLCIDTIVQSSQALAIADTKAYNFVVM